MVRYGPYLMELDPSVPQNCRDLDHYATMTESSTITHVGRGVFLDGHATPHPKETGPISVPEIYGTLFASTRFDPELPNLS